MKKQHFAPLIKVALAAVLLMAICLPTFGCASNNGTNTDNLMEMINTLKAENDVLKNQLNDQKTQMDELKANNEALTEKLDEIGNTVDKLDSISKAHDYDFYFTVGTLPTLYATLNAYTEQNPNTYMWFERGNTISYEYSADFINYFPTQSQTNKNSTYDQAVIRAKIEEILEKDPEAEFHFYCDDLRVALIINIFVRAGVDFEDLEVTILSDGTGTYFDFANQTDESYASYAETWNAKLKEAVDGRSDPNFKWPYADDESGVELRGLGYYLTTLPNVELWVQHPDYLMADSETVMKAKESMNIVKKDPKAMYDALGTSCYDYQKAVLANALVDSDTLTTLEQAAQYFDSKLKARDKDVVLILGTSKTTLAENKDYIDATVSFYTPTVLPNNKTTVMYKGKAYGISEGDTTVYIDGRTLKIGELGVYLFFKGHPAHIVDEEVQQYFADNGIEMLPHRTPVEVLFWMYDVKAGGFESTSFLSCSAGQTEFFFGMPTSTALLQMMDAGFFDGVKIF